MSAPLTKLIPAVAGCLAAAIGQSSVCADIIAVTGDIQSVTAPTSVQIGVLESGTAGVVFQEQSDYQLLADTRVSIPGTIGTYDEGSDMMPTDLTAGTVVNSYLLHFDTDFGAPNFEGTVEFADPIIGVMLRPFALNSSDAELGANGTAYPTNASARRGLDYDDFTPLDTFIISNDRTIAFDLVTSNAVDQIRVVTSAAAVPEPTGHLLLSVMGVLGLLVAVRPRSVAGPSQAVSVADCSSACLPLAEPDSALTSDAGAGATPSVC